MGATGAGSPTKWAPPSVVRTIEVHTGLLQGATPSSQYWSADMAVNESGSKPEGTGPPDDWEPLSPFGDTAVVVGAEVEEGVVEAVVVGAVVVGAVVVALVAAGALVVVGPTVVETGGVVVVGAALLAPLVVPQPAARSPADSNAAGQ